ncbi:glyoxylate/hydroxypyruvate reductase A [Wenzhouxiangella sp. XN79A]|uniref:NAD(P)-dependent oxidoreductase n=1 Tax=Wenzhouxiangella sp. XN79A TaxID=2724193 RepID=UPI00144AF097|nr:NAD(P)-dependent oxidoreductase [Wenzhouxiangella sp. XN79A]NKI34111.1 glyoxylate/hydroxypyruvate reductase A [Wenzhouxiangella sp. XN79A]
MAFLIIAPGRDTRALEAELRRLEPGLDLRVWPQLGDAAAIRFALAWNAPAGVFGDLPALCTVASLGAGVDALVDRPDLPETVPVTRLAGPRLAADLAAYLVAMTVDWWKRLDEQRHDRSWRPRPPRPAPRIGLLGLGRMGRRAAQAFRSLDLEVAGWNRSGRADDGLPVECGDDGLVRLAGRSDVLINLLPLTAATRGIIDARLLAALPADSLLINVGRGAHVIEHDLLAALDAGRPGRAVLDVFETEPLPDDHPFRRHPDVVVTPHVAALTDPREAAELALAQWRCVERGAPPPDAVDRVRGY